MAKDELDSNRPSLDHRFATDVSTIVQAVECVDYGNIEKLKKLIVANPNLVHARATAEVEDAWYGDGYFAGATLLHHVAGNPARRPIPLNIEDVARTLIFAGAEVDAETVSGHGGTTLGLVASGRAPREAGVQIALIDLLCDHGADPDRAMLAALGHGEFEAAYALICRGAKVDLPVTAAIGRADDARFLLPDADGDDRHRAVALSALHGHVEVVGMLLDAGEDPNRYNPIGLHGHSTPLHQAIYHGHMEVVQLLIERGARLDIRDTVSDGTPVEWAEHAGHVDIAEYVLARDGST